MYVPNSNRPQLSYRLCLPVKGLHVSSYVFMFELFAAVFQFLNNFVFSEICPNTATNNGNRTSAERSMFTRNYGSFNSKTGELRMTNAKGVVAEWSGRSDGLVPTHHLAMTKQ